MNNVILIFRVGGTISLMLFVILSLATQLETLASSLLCATFLCAFIDGLLSIRLPHHADISPSNTLLQAAYEGSLFYEPKFGYVGKLIVLCLLGVLFIASSLRALGIWAW